MNNDHDYPVGETFRRWLLPEPSAPEETASLAMMGKRKLTRLVGTYWDTTHEVTTACFQLLVGVIDDVPVWLLKNDALERLVGAIVETTESGITFYDFQHLRWYQKPYVNQSLYFYLDFLAAFREGRDISIRPITYNLKRS